MEKLICCTRISVDCVANDPVDVRCGGPKYLGFDFYVEKENTDKMKKFIIETCNTLQVPLLAIYNCEDKELIKEKVWTKRRIVEEISKDADDLRHEAIRYYAIKERSAMIFL